MGYDLKLERVIRAPRAKVFEAWSRPEALRQWFTPAPLGTGECSVDFRTGGAWTHVMLMPDGTPHTMRARYTEIVPLERIAFEADLSDGPKGKVSTTVSFSDEGSGTRIRVRQVMEGPIPEGDARAGWTSTLDQLAAQLEA